jgi:hypothetical protein
MNETKMRRIIVIENLKNFIITKPPTVLFLACLFSFIVVLSSYMEYLKTTHEPVANPDELDWNTFRQKLSRLDICVALPASNQSTVDSLAATNKKQVNQDTRKYY